MATIPRAWYNGSYTMAAKPIKPLELHYAMTQFLIKVIIYGLVMQPYVGRLSAMDVKNPCREIALTEMRFCIKVETRRDHGG